MSSTNSAAYKVQFQEAFHSQFSVPEYLLSNLTIYKRLVWNSTFFLGQWAQNVGTVKAGTVVRYGNLYHVNFCSGVSLDKIKSLVAQGYNPKLTLSFRTAKNPSMPSVVLVDFQRVTITEIVESHNIPAINLSGV